MDWKLNKRLYSRIAIIILKKNGLKDNRKGTPTVPVHDVSDRSHRNIHKYIYYYAEIKRTTNDKSILKETSVI